MENDEPTAICPVEGCSAERLTRGMGLHVYNSVGEGHGEHGTIPENVDFESMEISGTQQVDLGSIVSQIGIPQQEDHRDEGYIKCTSCTGLIPNQTDVSCHFEQSITVKPQSSKEGTAGSMQVRIPIGYLTTGGEMSMILGPRIASSNDSVPKNAPNTVREPTMQDGLVISSVPKAEQIASEDQLREKIRTMARTQPELTEEPTKDKSRQVRRDSSFSALVKWAYRFSCAVCGHKRLGPEGQPEVEAAHIYPKSEKGSDDIRNGVALCKLHHWAYDVGWFSVSSDLRVKIHGNPVRAGFQELTKYNGKKINTPRISGAEPSRLYIDARRDVV